MIDEERYPSTIQSDPFHDAPEVVTQQYPDPHGRDLLVTQQNIDVRDVERGKGMEAMTMSTPVTASGPPSGPPSGWAMSMAPPPSSLPTHTAEAASTAPSRRYCGLRRRTLFILIGVAVVIVVAAVVGGVVGSMAGSSDGSSSNNNNNNDNGGQNSPPPAESSSPTSVSPAIETGPIEPSQRQMAVSLSLDNDDNSDVQLFYQDLDTRAVHYRRILSDEAGDERTLDLDIEPTWGTPLAATAVSGSNPLRVLVYYVAALGGVIHIAQADLVCARGGGDCETRANSLLTEQSDHPLNPATKLAALHLDDDRVRVYYQAESNDLWSLGNDMRGTGGWKYAHMTPGGYPGTSLLAYGPNDTSIHFYYISDAEDERDALRHMQYADITGPGPDEAIQNSTGSAWSRNVSFAGMWDPTSIRLYYAKPDGGDILSNFNRFAEDQWRTNHEDNWGRVDGGFASLYWPGSSRLYWFQDGELRMSSQIPNAWTDPQTLFRESRN